MCPNLERPKIDERTEGQSRSNSIVNCTSQPEIQQQEKYRAPNIQRQLPAKAKVIKARVPNAYDQTALKLQVSNSHIESVFTLDC